MDLVKILQGLGSNDAIQRDASLALLSKLLKSQDSNSETAQERLEKYLKIWNCLFYCKNFLTIYLISRLLERR